MIRVNGFVRRTIGHANKMNLRIGLRGRVRRWSALNRGSLLGRTVRLAGWMMIRLSAPRMMLRSGRQAGRQRPAAEHHDRQEQNHPANADSHDQIVVWHLSPVNYAPGDRPTLVIRRYLAEGSSHRANRPALGVPDDDPQSGGGPLAREATPGNESLSKYFRVG